jgi:hypothetical protein
MSAGEGTERHRGPDLRVPRRARAVTRSRHRCAECPRTDWPAVVRDEAVGSVGSCDRMQRHRTRRATP